MASLNYDNSTTNDLEIVLKNILQTENVIKNIKLKID